MEEAEEFKYLGKLLSKYGSMKGKVRERTVNRRQTIGSIKRIMRGRGVNMKVRKGLRNSMVLPTLTYAPEKWA